MARGSCRTRERSSGSLKGESPVKRSASMGWFGASRWWCSRKGMLASVSGPDRCKRSGPVLGSAERFPFRVADPKADRRDAALDQDLDSDLPLSTVASPVQPPRQARRTPDFPRHQVRFGTCAARPFHRRSVPSSPSGSTKPPLPSRPRVVRRAARRRLVGKRWARSGREPERGSAKPRPADTARPAGPTARVLSIRATAAGPHGRRIRMASRAGAASTRASAIRAPHRPRTRHASPCECPGRGHVRRRRPGIRPPRRKPHGPSRVYPEPNHRRSFPKDSSRARRGIGRPAPPGRDRAAFRHAPPPPYRSRGPGQPPPQLRRHAPAAPSAGGPRRLPRSRPLTTPLLSDRRFGAIRSSRDPCRLEEIARTRRGLGQLPPKK